jgi:acyl-CoA hydrolase
MKRTEIKLNDTLFYSGGPVRGGWFTVFCRAKILEIGTSRVKVRLEATSEAPEKTVWVTPSHLSLKNLADKEPEPWLNI